ncbi:hypothetical protein JXA31_01705 [Candidatus Bathyarchaeota archaeon]|nr:hypothetical protein [Candidatus Bathyarchaeota archaeon]
MKTVIKNIYVTTLVCIAFLTSFQVLSVRCSSDPIEDLASEFIQNGLPIDISKYEMTLTPHASLYASAVECTLKSEQSVLNVNCYFQNNTLCGCNLYLKNGFIIYDKQYANLTDAAIGFLEKYQSYIKRDSTELINVLRNVDTNKNSTAIKGNIKLTVITKEDNVTEYTRFGWTWTVEGVDYPMMGVSFKNGAFYGFTDNRGLYTIGDTTVNTSKEQAINAAIEYVKTYSYVLSDGSLISGFNVDENRAVAKLTCAIRNSSVLYPMWNVVLFLDHVYPGSVNAFSIAVWAKSGEVFNIGIHKAPREPPMYYDPSMDPTLDVNIWNPPPNIDTLNLSPDESSPNPPPNTYLVIAAVALIIIAIIAVFIKRRRK